MGSIDDSWIAAAVEQEVQTLHRVVLRRQVHGDGLDTMAFTAEVVPEIRIGTVVEQAGGGLHLVAVTGPEERRAAERIRVHVGAECDQRGDRTALVVARRPGQRFVKHLLPVQRPVPRREEHRSVEVQTVPGCRGQLSAGGDEPAHVIAEGCGGCRGTRG